MQGSVMDFQCVQDAIDHFLSRVQLAVETSIPKNSGSIVDLGYRGGLKLPEKENLPETTLQQWSKRQGAQVHWIVSLPALQMADIISLFRSKPVVFVQEVKYLGLIFDKDYIGSSHQTI